VPAASDSTPSVWSFQNVPIALGCRGLSQSPIHYLCGRDVPLPLVFRALPNQSVTFLSKRTTSFYEFHFPGAPLNLLTLHLQHVVTERFFFSTAFQPKLSLPPDLLITAPSLLVWYIVPRLTDHLFPDLRRRLDALVKPHLPHLVQMWSQCHYDPAVQLVNQSQKQPLSMVTRGQSVFHGLPIDAVASVQTDPVRSLLLEVLPLPHSPL
jgi:hypothetical protein